MASDLAIKAAERALLRARPGMGIVSAQDIVKVVAAELDRHQAPAVKPVTPKPPDQINSYIEGKGPNPRRRVILLAAIEADTRRDLAGHLNNLGRQIEIDGFKGVGISGGYSAGHIAVLTEDEAITHDSWAAALDAYLKQVAERERAEQAAPVDHGGEG